MTKAVSVGFGVFMGIVPLWGFQMLIAIAVSIYYRLNKVLVLLASQVSILPLMPFILYGSHRMGAIWLGDKAQTISFNRDITISTFGSNLFQYAIGAVTLATIAGLFFGLVTYVLLTIQRRVK